MKYEWKKSEKHLYGVKQKAELVAVPTQTFIMIKGEGNPNETDFSSRVSALYSLAYAIKMRFKALMKTALEGQISDFAVYPLEGVWEKAAAAGAALDKSRLKYTLMIRQPDWVGQEVFEQALADVQKKKPNNLYKDICFDRMADGKAVQILHIGSYDHEPASFEKMDRFVREMGLLRSGDTHREIYLNNAGRTAEDKLKTILRYAVREMV